MTFPIAALFGFFFGFAFGIGCSLAVLFAIYMGGYRAAVTDADMDVPPKRLLEARARLASRQRAEKLARETSPR